MKKLILGIVCVFAVTSMAFAELRGLKLRTATKVKSTEITEAQVLAAQEEWRKGILFMSKNRLDFDKVYQFANVFASNVYAYGQAETLFKPTVAMNPPFRLTKESAVSYFVGRNPKFPEDTGFALNPWVDIEFNNVGIGLVGSFAYVMGSYDFTLEDGEVITVEYSFVYTLIDSKVKIILHHSSLPYTP